MDEQWRRHAERVVKVQFAMVVLDVRDLRRSIDFYRLLGVDVAEPVPERPVSVTRLGGGASLLIAEGFFGRSDDGWQRPERDAYQQMTEFVVPDDESVRTVWTTLTAAGHHGRTPPGRTAGPYGAMVDDPDGNVVLITSDVAALSAR